MKNMRPNICIVAHPDDETLFLGAQLSCSPRDWHVVCVTNGDNEERRSEFEKTMLQMGCTYEIWPLKDEWKVPLDEKELISELKELFKTSWGIVATHDPDGDIGYEHPHHEQVSRCVREVLEDTSKLYCFCPDEYLPPELIRNKLKLLNNYKSQIRKYDFIFTPLLEEYFFKEGLKKYEGNYSRD